MVLCLISLISFVGSDCDSWSGPWVLLVRPVGLWCVLVSRSFAWAVLGCFSLVYLLLSIVLGAVRTSNGYDGLKWWLGCRESVGSWITGIDAMLVCLCVVATTYLIDSSFVSVSRGTRVCVDIAVRFDGVRWWLGGRGSVGERNPYVLGVSLCCGVAYLMDSSFVSFSRAFVWTSQFVLMA